MFIDVQITKPKNPERVAVVVAVALIVVSILVWGGLAQRDGAPSAERPVEIQQLFPAESQLMLPQGSVGADLRDEFTGQVTVDGRLIPQDQTTIQNGLGVVLFEPGEGKDIEEFRKGAHNATIEWWPRTFTTPEDAAAQRQLRSYSWAFNVG
jgi:hypothetical protein